MSDEKLHLPDEIRMAVHAHAMACVPDECCGLVASDMTGAIRFAYPLTNSEPSPAGYTVAPDEHFAAQRHAESMGWEISGVFHSHPNGLAAPSATDVDRALDPNWAYLIHGQGQIRGFRIKDGVVAEIELT